ncbi:MAG: NAD-dependent succinate-semialdehyde dehydrogenase [Planctomycetes bacterium]|nr:NAD-dependent succinate-semialdehyde dehydrogenase [Planctomycetota bacterium]
MRPVNPATEEPLREYPEHTAEQLEARLTSVDHAFRIWRARGIQDRAPHLARTAGLLRDDREQLARLMTEEMGKPIAQAEAEIDKCAWVCEYYARHAAEFLEPRCVDTDASRSVVRFEPLGPVLAIMPWNFPLWQVFRFAAPAVMAGNVVLLKHADNVPGIALAVENLFRRSGFPEGVLTTLLMSVERVEAVIEDGRVRGVTLTGSVRAGREVASQAGRRLKKTVLELGGSDPFIVLGDADLDTAVETAVKSRTQNSGQSCIAAKRFIAESGIADQFEEAMVAKMRGLKVGDPTQRETDIGPLARKDLLKNLHDQVERSVAAGARRVLGGKRLDRKGWYYPPTVLSAVEPGMAAFDEETFGPVAAIIRAQDAEHAVELANRSTFGLGASLWTRDMQRAAALVPRLEAGAVFVNEMVKSDPRLPFGGIKDSGWGRELGEEGLREFTNRKTVWVA